MVINSFLGLQKNVSSIPNELSSRPLLFQFLFKLQFQKLHTDNDNTLRTNNTYRNNNIWKKILLNTVYLAHIENFALETP